MHFRVKERDFIWWGCDRCWQATVDARVENPMFDEQKKKNSLTGIREPKKSLPNSRAKALARTH